MVAADTFHGGLFFAGTKEHPHASKRLLSLISQKNPFSGFLEEKSENSD